MIVDDAGVVVVVVVVVVAVVAVIAERMDCADEDRCSGARRGSGGKREAVVVEVSGCDCGEEDDDVEEEDRTSNMFDVGIGIDGRVEEDAIGIVLELLLLFLSCNNNKRLGSAVVLCSI